MIEKIKENMGEHIGEEVKIIFNGGRNRVEEYKSFPVNKTDYVFRTAGKNKFGKVKAQYFTSRINSIIKEAVGNSYINITNLYFSGMIDLAEKIRAEKGTDLDINDYMTICEKFNYGEPEIVFNGEESYKVWKRVAFTLKKVVEDYFRAKGE
jgi:hypothetical protein